MGLFCFSVARADSSPPDYDHTFPFIAEVCGLSKENLGNSWGHAVIYLKGVCRSRVSEDYADTRPGQVAPWKLKICDDHDPLEDVPVGGPGETLEKGVWISADSKVMNSHWIAIPGRNLGLNGGLPVGKRYDTAQNKAIWDRILSTRAYDGLKLTPSSQVEFEKDLARSVEEYLITYAFGTDFAVSLARNAKCWKIPVSQKQMMSMVDYANRVNETSYQWNFFSSNCNHLVTGILAAAKIVSPAQMGAWNLFHLDKIFPTDTLVRIGRKARAEIPTVEEVFGKSRLREALEQFGRMPVQYGMLWGSIPFIKKGNVAFVENERRWGWIGEGEKLRAMDQDSLLTDFDSGLNEYSRKLERAHLRLKSKAFEDRVSRVAVGSRESFARVFRLYESWLVEVSQELKVLMNARGMTSRVELGQRP